MVGKTRWDQREEIIMARIGIIQVVVAALAAFVGMDVLYSVFCCNPSGFWWKRGRNGSFILGEETYRDGKHGTK